VTSPLPAARCELETSDGIRLAARRWDAAGDARAAVVLVHGFAGSSDEPRVVALAEALSASGHTVLACDARGHGASGGGTTLGDLERHDVAVAVKELASERVPLVVVGESMGAIAVLWHVTNDPEHVDGVVLVSCTSRWRLPLNLRGVLAALVTQTPVGRWIARQHMHVRIAKGGTRPPPPIEMVRGLRVPVALVHGRRDPFIRPSDAEELFAAASEPRRLVLVDSMGHSFEPSAVEPIVDAIEWVLAARS